MSFFRDDEAYEDLDFDENRGMYEDDRDEYAEWNDGQPSEYEEWQDVYGGDDWDHGQFDNDF